VVLSEWIKFRSLRSTVYTLLVAVVLMIGLGALLSAVAVSQPNGLDAGVTAISTSLTGTFFAQLAIGVLGILLITGEYSTGMIRASLAVVPARLPMLWAKLAVCAGAVFLTMLVSSLTAFTLGQALLSRKHLNASLADPAALRAIVGAALYLTVAAITALALGALLRNTAAAISTFVAVFFVIPPLAPLLPASWSGHFVQYLPSNAGAMMLQGTDGLAHPLSVDRIRGDVRLRIGPYRVRRMATAPRRRLTPFRAPGRSRPGGPARREGFWARPGETLTRSTSCRNRYWRGYISPGAVTSVGRLIGLDGLEQYFLLTA
jgi:hypothetical protein